MKHEFVVRRFDVEHHDGIAEGVCQVLAERGGWLHEKTVVAHGLPGATARAHVDQMLRLNHGERVAVVGLVTDVEVHGRGSVRV